MHRPTNRQTDTQNVNNFTISLAGKRRCRGLYTELFYYTPYMDSLREFDIPMWNITYNPRLQASHVVGVSDQFVSTPLFLLRN